MACACILILRGLAMSMQRGLAMSMQRIDPVVLAIEKEQTRMHFCGGGRRLEKSMQFLRLTRYALASLAVLTPDANPACVFLCSWLQVVASPVANATFAHLTSFQFERAFGGVYKPHISLACVAQVKIPYSQVRFHVCIKTEYRRRILGTVISLKGNVKNRLSVFSILLHIFYVDLKKIRISRVHVFFTVPSVFMAPPNCPW